MNVGVDFIGKEGIQGNVASMLSSMNTFDYRTMRPFVDTTIDANGKPGPGFGKTYVTRYIGGDPKNSKSYQARPIQRNDLQVNSTLRRDEWKRLDEAVLPFSDFRLGGIADLIDNNLVYDIGNGMGVTVLEYHDISDAMEADLTMDGITRSQGDRPVYTTNYLPLPIIHVDFEINTRALSVSRNLGQPLDTSGAERAARKVNEKLEAMLFTATSYTFGGGTIYSYLNHPNRNQITLTENWDASGKTGLEIINDVRSMKQAAIDDRHFGPYMLYVPTAYETVLDADYDTTTPGTTIRERILKIDKINGIKVIDTLTANNVLLVQMDSNTVRLVRGMGLTNVEWENEGGMVGKYKVMTIQVPQVRADQAGRAGVIHLAA